MDRSTTRVEGLKEFYVALKLLSPELAKELNVALREIVKHVEEAAVQEADYQGFTPPGRSGRGVGNLIGQIRSGVTMTKGYVTDTANRDGYYYPARYEYQAGNARAFLHPAIDKNRDMIYASLVAAVDVAIAAFDDGAAVRV